MITLDHPERKNTHMMYGTTKGNDIPIVPWDIIRVVPLKEVRLSCYKDMADLAKIFNHKIVEVKSEKSPDGWQWRWQPNRLIYWIFNHCPVYIPSTLEMDADLDAEFKDNPKMQSVSRFIQRGEKHRGSLSIESLSFDLEAEVFTMEEWMKFQMQIGSSLCYYSEVFGSSEAAELGLPGAKKPVDDGSYTETPIDYMNRIHKGNVLSL